jgi:hypothetical protein
MAYRFEKFEVRPCKEFSPGNVCPMSDAEWQAEYGSAHPDFYGLFGRTVSGKLVEIGAFDSRQEAIRMASSIRPA